MAPATAGLRQALLQGKLVWDACDAVAGRCRPLTGHLGASGGWAASSAAFVKTTPAATAMPFEMRSDAFDDNGTTA